MMAMLHRAHYVKDVSTKSCQCCIEHTMLMMLGLCTKSFKDTMLIPRLFWHKLRINCKYKKRNYYNTFINNTRKHLNVINSKPKPSNQKTTIIVIIIILANYSKPYARLAMHYNRICQLHYFLTNYSTKNFLVPEWPRTTTIRQSLERESNALTTTPSSPC
jgi:hypothetical protein